MAEVLARVERVRNGLAWVEIVETTSGCGRCNEPGGCQSLRLTEAFGPRVRQFALPNDINADVGDMVGVAIEDGMPLKSALISYGVGTLLVLLGALGGRVLLDGDGAAVVGAVCGLALTVMLTRWFRKRWRAIPRLVHPSAETVLPRCTADEAHD